MNPRDLIEQAYLLANLGAGRPKQVHLRRAISGVYYALFNQLTFDAARLFVRGGVEAQSRLRRSIRHQEVFEVARRFHGGTLPRRFEGTLTITDELSDAAGVFMELQKARHDADYEPTRTFRKEDVHYFADAVERVLDRWSTLRTTDEGRLFLGCFKLWKEWDRPYP